MPFKDPVLIFAILMAVILLAPFLFRKLRIPQIIGLIISGLIIGPYGLKILERDSSIELFGTVGLLYIMFLAGIEINLNDFTKRRNQSIIFGILSFIIPFTAGTSLGYYIFGYPLTSSLLIGSIFSSHTLVTYPIISRFGLARRRSVNIAIGGTILTDTVSLLILSVIASVARDTGNGTFWLKLGIAVPVFGAGIIYGIPMLARWFFKKSSDHISQYVFVISILFLAAFIAEMAEIEPVIAAFLAGLAFNRLIPHTSGLMNRIEFMGNALFIPVFLIGVGMLIDLKLLFSGWHAFYVAFLTITFAILSKFLAAYSTQKIFGLGILERKMIFGLSNSRAAAALAAAIIGFNIIIDYQGGETGKLLGEEVLNATILLILFTCGLSSFEVEKAAREMVTHEEAESTDLLPDIHERILVPVSNPDTVESLVEFASMIKSPNLPEPVYVLNVIDKAGDAKIVLESKKLMDKAVKALNLVNLNAVQLTRFDLNPVLGILHTIKENQVSDLVIGLFGKKSYMETFFGNINENVIRRTAISVFISKFIQPLNTISNILVFIPPKAEYEPGFVKWLGKLRNIALVTGKKMIFYAEQKTIRHLEYFIANQRESLNSEIRNFNDWKNLSRLKISKSKNSLIVVVTSRPKSISHFPYLEQLPSLLTKHFAGNNIILIYPEVYDSIQHMNIRDLGGTLTGQIEQQNTLFATVGNRIKKVIGVKKQS